MPKQPLAPCQHILPSGLEIIGVPGIGYLLVWLACVLHQEVHLPIEIAAADAVHIVQILPVHPNQQIVPIVVAVLELAGRFASTVDPVLGQLLPGGRIHRIADLLPAGSR